MVVRTNTVRAGRALPLDLFKTLLVAGMISAHVIQLITEEPPRWAWIWSDVVNLITFSGFMLAFGLGVGLSTERTRQRSLGERAWPAIKMLIAVWVSSFGFLLLVERATLDGWLIRELMMTEVLFGWSEFLTSFLVLYILLAIARPAFIWVATRPTWLIAASGSALAATMVTTGAYWPLVGGLIGHQGYPNFPVLSYLPWFLIGIHLGARWPWITAGEIAVGAAATGSFLLFLWQEGRLPERFPPSLLWIIGPGLPLALYLWTTEQAARWVPYPEVVLAAGRHVLASLVLSNLLIFSVRYVWGWPVVGAWEILGTSLGLVVTVTLWGVLLSSLSGFTSRR